MGVVLHTATRVQTYARREIDNGDHECVFSADWGHSVDCSVCFTIASCIIIDIIVNGTSE